MSHDKFIHHERVCALHSSDNGESGCFEYPTREEAQKIADEMNAKGGN